MLLVAMSDSYGPREFYYTRADEREDTVCGTRLEPLRGIRNDYNFTLVETPCLYKETVDMMVHMFPSMGKLVLLSRPRPLPQPSSEPRDTPVSRRPLSRHII